MKAPGQHRDCSRTSKNNGRRTFLTCLHTPLPTKLIGNGRERIATSARLAPSLPKLVRSCGANRIDLSYNNSLVRLRRHRYTSRTPLRGHQRRLRPPSAIAIANPFVEIGRAEPFAFGFPLSIASTGCEMYRIRFHRSSLPSLRTPWRYSGIVASFSATRLLRSTVLPRNPSPTAQAYQGSSRNYVLRHALQNA